MATEFRRQLIAAQQKRRQARTRALSPFGRGWWVMHGVRVAFLGLVLTVLGGVWSIVDAHLTEQFRANPVQNAALIDPETGQGALTPDNIEQAVLRFNLSLRTPELSLTAGDDPRPRPFVIYPGEAARFVADRLQRAGLVSDADLMNLYLRVNRLERRIEAGNFMLAPTMTIPEIATALQQASFEEVLVTLPEGMRAEEIAERLAAAFVIEPDRFLTAVRQPRSLTLFDNYSFLQELPPTASLEGYLFPDTYRFPVNAVQPEQVLAVFLDNFANKVGQEGLRGSAGFSGHNLLNLASIVEREAVLADERPLIASVYLNRLNGNCAAEVGGTYLQADPTVQYARGTVGDWWWKPQSIAEYSSVISPYNTYLYPGLPPGPIANPGLSAIEATRAPAETRYCFFLATGENGSHVFAQTLAEHERNLAIYGYQ